MDRGEKELEKKISKLEKKLERVQAKLRQKRKLLADLAYIKSIEDEEQKRADEKVCDFCSILGRHNCKEQPLNWCDRCKIDGRYCFCC